MKENRKYKTIITILIVFMAVTSSCVPGRKLKYINDINEIQGPITNPVIQKRIMPFDKLMIRAISSDANTNELFGQINSDLTASAAPTGYIVDVDGNIIYPFIGKINVSGLTTEEAADKLLKALNEYAVVATVKIQYLEKSVTLMGSVGGQGVFPYTQDKLTIYEALALAGGISQYGDRENVILIRQEGNEIRHMKLNLTDSRIASKEYYYIMAGDIIIVEPLRSASWFNFNSSISSLVLTAISSLFLVYSFLGR